MCGCRNGRFTNPSKGSVGSLRGQAWPCLLQRPQLFPQALQRRAGFRLVINLCFLREGKRSLGIVRHLGESFRREVGPGLLHILHPPLQEHRIQLALAGELLGLHPRPFPGFRIKVVRRMEWDGRPYALTCSTLREAC